MIPGAEKMMAQLESQNENGRPRLQNQKAIRASRKTGKFLSAHQLDELPQLFNVLIGDMSLRRPPAFAGPGFSRLQRGLAEAKV